jgi:hypothetical protein
LAFEFQKDDCSITVIESGEKEFIMSKRGKLKAEKMFADAKKKNEQSENRQDQEKKERAQRTASLKALRLAKAASDEKIANAAKTK